MGHKKLTLTAKLAEEQNQVDHSLTSEVPETSKNARKQVTGKYTCRLCESPPAPYTLRQHMVSHLVRVHGATKNSTAKARASSPVAPEPSQVATLQPQAQPEPPSYVLELLQEQRKMTALLEKQIELLTQQKQQQQQQQPHPPASPPPPPPPLVHSSLSPSPEPEFLPPLPPPLSSSPHVLVSPASRQRLGRECSPVVLPDGSEWMLNSDLACALQKVCGFTPTQAKDTLRPLSKKGKKVKKDTDPRLFSLLKGYRDSRDMRHQNLFVLVKANAARSFCNSSEKLSKEQRTALRKHIFGSP